MNRRCQQDTALGSWKEQCHFSGLANENSWNCRNNFWKREKGKESNSSLSTGSRDSLGKKHRKKNPSLTWACKPGLVEIKHAYPDALPDRVHPQGLKIAQPMEHRRNVRRLRYTIVDQCERWVFFWITSPKCKAATNSGRIDPWLLWGG